MDNCTRPLGKMSRTQIGVDFSGDSRSTPEIMVEPLVVLQPVIKVDKFSDCGV